MYWLGLVVAFIGPVVGEAVDNTCTPVMSTSVWYKEWLEYTRDSSRPLQHPWPALQEELTCRASHAFYTLTPIKLGCEARGIDLKQHVSEEVRSAMKDDVHRHRILVFKDQGVISAERQAEIAGWFAELDSVITPHPKSHLRTVLKISNDDSEGYTKVGITAWHLDGIYLESPSAYVVYHMVNVSSQGATLFIPLPELIEQLPLPRLLRWERLSIVLGMLSCPVHPLIYSHAITNKKVLLTHVGRIREYIWDHGTPQERVTEGEETQAIHQEIEHELNQHKDLIYAHEWSVGDLMVTENLSLAHRATPETQLPASQIGLRVLHRVTTKGYPTRPRKMYTVDPLADTFSKPSAVKQPGPL